MDKEQRERCTKLVKDFLESHRKAVISVVDEKGHPRTSLMLYVVDDNLNMYFGTRKCFGKYERLKNHPYVSLSVIEEKLDPLKAVDVYGPIEFISDEKIKDTLAFFESKNPSKYYVKGAPDFVMFKVIPDGIRWHDAESGELEITGLEMK